MHFPIELLVHVSLITLLNFSEVLDWVSDASVGFVVRLCEYHFLVPTGDRMLCHDVGTGYRMGFSHCTVTQSHSYMYLYMIIFVHLYNFLVLSKSTSPLSIPVLISSVIMCIIICEEA